jgi:hypothetical protein
MARERTKARCGQGLPRINREVRARVVVDAIVSTKTFLNATFARTSCQNLAGDLVSKAFSAVKPFERARRLFASTGIERAKTKMHTYPPAFALQIYPPSQNLMLERIGKVKQFSLFLRVAFDTGRLVLSYRYPPLFYLRRSLPAYLSVLCPAGSGQTSPAGAWSNW